VNILESETDRNRISNSLSFLFVLQLMKVLCQPEYEDIIAWLPDGKSFTIVRPKAFVADILPDHFKQAKYSSFTRKLHRWGFQRHLRGEEAGAFFHKLFQRGRLDLVEKMTCYKSDMDRAVTPLVGNKGSFGVSFRDPAIARHGQQANRSLLLQQQQQQLQQQIQQQSLMMQDQLRQPMHSTSQRTGGAGGEGSVDRLNAAIELEVNRRLKERITAASISRQALALMQQQQLPVSNNDLTFGGPSGSNSMPLSLNLLGKDETSTSLYNQSSFKNRSADRSFYVNSGGQDSLGLTQAQQQQLQLHQLQQQQAQLQQQQQQLQQQGMWGGQSFAFDNQGM
jgi:HSF-type DNA-binding